MFDKAYFDQIIFDGTAVTIKTSSDTGSGVDAKVALFATLVKTDTGTGVDAFTGNRDITLFETGEGAEGK